jgi:hypothetical protein
MNNEYYPKAEHFIKCDRVSENMFSGLECCWKIFNGSKTRVSNWRVRHARVIPFFLCSVQKFFLKKILQTKVKTKKESTFSADKLLWSKTFQNSSIYFPCSLSSFFFFFCNRAFFSFFVKLKNFFSGWKINRKKEKNQFVWKKTKQFGLFSSWKPCLWIFSESLWDRKHTFQSNRRRSKKWSFLIAWKVLSIVSHKQKGFVVNYFCFLYSCEVKKNLCSNWKPFWSKPS